MRTRGDGRCRGGVGGVLHRHLAGAPADACMLRLEMVQQQAQAADGVEVVGVVHVVHPLPQLLQRSFFARDGGVVRLALVEVEVFGQLLRSKCYNIQ